MPGGRRPGYAYAVPGAGGWASDGLTRGLVEFSRAASEARSAAAILDLLVASAVEHGLAEAAAVFQIGDDERATIVAARNLPPELDGFAIELEDVADLAARVRDLVGARVPGIVTLPLVAGGDLYGILALLGMITKNAVILIGQIESERAQGKDVTTAAIDASSTRFRPIMLTAISTVLGMIPIAPTVFWGPMAFAIMGGLLVATILTLVFLPTLYVAWFSRSSTLPKPDKLQQRLKSLISLP